MSVKEFNLPDLGEGLTEGEILKWLVNVGDVIELNQPIVEVETAKAAVEIPAKWAGKVVEIHHPEGTVVEVGSPIIAIDTDPSGSSASGPVDDMSSQAAAGAEKAAAPDAGLIGGPAPGGRTAVLVGYGPRTTEAKRRPRVSSSPAAPAAAPAAAAAPTAPAAPAPAPVAPAAPAPVNGGASVLAKPPVRKLA
ncbi:MAG: 2-oxo acid dehydrogenase subunit E2, partial [Hamadaea sp.]|nr:2-oxo acid dehydrogenase subunit E2 [Hamadaea sp.]